MRDGGGISGRGSISLAMIVKNEEKYLRGCLESTAPYVGQMVIVDTGSTDGTIEIAREFGATIIPFAWTGNFSEARNVSLDHSTGEWILYLDADERLVDGIALRSLVSNPSRWAYSLLIKGMHHLASGAVEQVNAYPRLFRNHPSLRFEGVVHEQIHPSLRRIGKTIMPSTVVIEHLGYGESYATVQEKSRRNILLLQEHIGKNPQDVYARYQLGNTYVVLKEYARAEEALRPLIQLTADPVILASASNLLVETAISRNDLSEAEYFCRQSLLYVPEQTMARWFLSGILAYRRTFEQSLEILKQLRAEKNSGSGETGLAHDIILQPAQIEERMRLCFDELSAGELRLSHPDAAERWIREAESENVRSLALQRRGLELSLAQRDVARALSRLDYVVQNLPEEASLQRQKFIAIRSKLADLPEVNFP